MKPFMIAFSMYSKIPMPHFDWEERDRKTAFCFFPMVGVAVGILFYLVFCILEFLQTGPLLKGAFLAAVPIFVTGGIHMDGFLDTCDARASYGDRKKKLDILKDSHTGAFAIIYGILYMLLMAGAYGELNQQGAEILSAGFVLSRSLSGLAVAVLPGAREHGMLADFTKDSNKVLTARYMAGYFVCSAAVMIGFGILSGGKAAVGQIVFSGNILVCQVLPPILMIITAVLVWIYYRHMALKEFGGVTGDLAGFFLQMCELMMALAAAFCW